MENNKLNTEDMKCVEELRARLKGVLNAQMYNDTRMFIRFLTARNYDLDSAETMLRNHINWRETSKVDDILSWYKQPEVLNYCPFTPLGFDKEGSLVIFVHFGNFDIPGFTKSLKSSEIVDYIIHHLETNIRTVEQQSQKLNKEIEKFTYVLDFENFLLRTATHKPSLDIIRKIVSLFEANYPERLKCGLLYNTSIYFQIAFAIVKPLLTGTTARKLKIFGKNGWQEELHKQMDVDDLPGFLGGNRTDPDGDPMCKTFINHGGFVPESYYKIHQKDLFENQPGVEKITINRYSKKLIELDVLNPDSDIEWEFKTKDKDIAFGLYFKMSNNSSGIMKEIMPKQRFEASNDSEVGLFRCKKPGTYYIEFDNSYSWIYQKEVYYKVQVVPSHSPNNTT